MGIHPYTVSGNTVVRPLIEPAADREVKALSLFAKACKKLTQEELAQIYRTEMGNAPARKSYLTDSRQGTPSTGGTANHREEHFAMAIFNEHRPPNPGLRLPGGDLHILDYQLPLKAKHDDARVGKLDLFGITSSGQATIIELKSEGGRDTPLRAPLEGLAYAAIVQANLATLRKEVRQLYSRTIATDIPGLIVMAPEEYWLRFRTNHAAGDWDNPLQAVADHILQGIGVPVDFIALRNSSFVHGSNSTRPALESAITCVPALSGKP